MSGTDGGQVRPRYLTQEDKYDILMQVDTATRVANYGLFSDGAIRLLITALREQIVDLQARVRALEEQ